MRPVRLYIAASLDGYIAREDDGLDWLPQPDDQADDLGYGELLQQTDGLLMGRRTYDVIRQLGPWPYGGLPKYVFSRGTRPVEVYSPSTVVLTESPAEAVARLRAGTGLGFFLLGWGQLIQALHQADLIDDYHVALVPCLLGGGLPLFPALGRQQNLRLTGQRSSPNGLVLLSYARA